MDSIHADSWPKLAAKQFEIIALVIPMNSKKELKQFFFAASYNFFFK